MQLNTILAPGTFYEMTDKEAILYGLLALTLFLVVFVLVLAVWAIRVLSGLATEAEAKAASQAQTYVPARPKLSFWQQLDRRYITAAVPVEEERRIELNHNYDGIKELDNHLPPWWTGMFYGTVAFSVVYMLIFHVWLSAPLPAEELALEQKQAQIDIAAYQAKAADAIDERNVTMAENPQELESGQALFDKNCKVCHGAQGQGGVGPNLTDEYWIHGGALQDVFKTIKYGVPQKGMIAWKASFKPVEIKQVASYILTLQGSNPPGAKAPQGERYTQTGNPKGAPAEQEASADKAGKGMTAMD